MMPEISLNILDIAQNSIKAGAHLITVRIVVDTNKDSLVCIIGDDGCGMPQKKLKKVIDPFYTSRKERNVGLGIPFMKMAAEITGGSFDIKSTEGEGTVVSARFVLGSIDRQPLGDINATMETLICGNPDIDFVYTYDFDGRSFELDTRVMREILDGIPTSEPRVARFIRDYLETNAKEADGGLEY